MVAMERAGEPDVDASREPRQRVDTSAGGTGSGTGGGPRDWPGLVLRSLFPEPAAGDGTGREAMWAVGTGLAAAAITVARVPFIFDSFWAEDGGLFYQEALTRKRPGVFVEWYAGYLQAVPRLIAAIAAAFPVRDAAAVFAVCVLAIVAAGAAFVEIRSADYISRRWLRIGLGLSVAFLPVLREEVIGNAANIQFLLVFFGFWLLLWFPRRRVGAVAAAVALLLISLSTLLAVFLVPVALARLLVRHRRGTWLPPLGLLAGVAVQFGGRAIVHATRPVQPADVATALDWFKARIVTNVGSGASVSSTIHVGLVVLAALAVVVVGAFVGRPAQPGAGTPTPVARTMIVVSLALCLLTGLAVATTSGIALRYAVVPALFLVTALAVACDHTLDVRPNWMGWIPVGIVVAAIVAAAYTGRQASPWRGEASIVSPTSQAWAGPWWSHGVDAARVQCQTTPVGAAVSIKSFPGPWVVTVPCAVLER